MGKVDLHMHSIYSDGCDSLEELIDLAKKKGLTTISLTDHDNITGSKELMKLDKCGLNIYSGVELTAKVAKGRMHILGYNIDLEDVSFNKKLSELHDTEVYNILLYVSLLKKEFGIIISEEKLAAIIETQSNIGRPQLAMALIDMGLCSDVDEAFVRYLNPIYEKARKVKKGLTKEEAISLIVGAGGVATLAHPVSLLMDAEEMKREVKLLKEIGLGALESTHIHISDDLRKFYHELALYYDLLETGGTDYHGFKVKPNVEMGTGIDNNIDIEEESLSFLLKVNNRY